MASAFKILGIRGSYGRIPRTSLMREARELVPEGVTPEIFDLAGIPPFNQDEERQPPPCVVVIATSAQRFNEQGELTDETSRKLIRQLLESLIAWSRRVGASA